MGGVQVRPYRTSDETAVIALWRACGLVRPWNDPRKDLARKLADSPDSLLVAEADGALVGTVMAGYDGHRGWINYLAVAPERQRGGLGRRLMAEAEQVLRGTGCPKINLQVRTDNAEVLAFYARIGFVRDEVVSLGKRLEQD